MTIGLGIASAAGHSSRWQLTIVVTLATLALTALVEMYLEVERNSAELRNARREISVVESAALKLSPLVAAPSAFQEFAENVASNSRSIQNDGHAFFRAIFDKLQRQFQQAAADIAAGRIEIDAEAPYSFRSATFDGFRSMRMVHVRGLDFWESRRGKSYMERQQIAVNAGRLSVERIFVLPSSGQKHRASRVIAEQVAAGIRVHVIIIDARIEREIARDAIDMGIVEDVTGAQMVVRLGQEGVAQGFFNADREVLSHRPDDIDHALGQFERLLNNSLPATEIYPDLASNGIS